MKVLFIGNSITRHELKEDIKWYQDCGMAATKLENDYVHQCVKMLNQKAEVEYMLRNVADWERDFRMFDLDLLLKEQEFCADVLVMRIGENLNQEDCLAYDFKNYYIKLIDFLTRKNANCKIITTSNFWGYGKELYADEVVMNLSKKRGYRFVELGDLGKGNQYKAYPRGRFQPTYSDIQGVCEHPNDKGMKKIAKRIYTAIKETAL